MMMYRHAITAICLAALVGPVAIAATPDVLPPEEAFRYEVTVDADALSVHYDIEPGYYLYRHRFGFASDNDGVTLGEADIPPGKAYTDEFFGNVETYRDAVTIRVPYTRVDPGVEVFDLELKLQGCADIGLCYPPQNWTTPITLALATDTAAVATQEQKPLDLKALFAAGDANEVRPPEEVFVFSAHMADPYTVVGRWDIADGTYLYKDKIRFETDSPLVQLGAPELPKGKVKFDEYFGESEVYYGSVEARIRLARSGPEAGSFELIAGAQGCVEDKLCYPPFEQTVALALPEAITPDDAAFIAVVDEPVSEQDRLASLIRDSHPVAFLAAFFGLGLLLAFTPCVLPMIPILSGIIAGEGDDIDTGRAFRLSLAYVLGMALTYTAAGTAAAYAGQQMQAIFQQPWILATFALLFVGLALSMFGLYELQMPSAIQSKVANVSGRQKTGTYWGTAIIGALSALIVTACVAPPLVAALAVIGQTGEPLRGGGALFAMSIGMGTPLLIVGASAGTLLPKAGPWMDTIKAAFGVMLLGVSIWMISRIVPEVVTMTLWAALMVVSGVYMLGSAGETGWAKLWKGVGVLAVTWGVLILIGAAAGGRDPMQPLKGVLSSATHAGMTEQAVFKRVKTVADLENELYLAAQNGRIAMIDFYADWCVECIKMEKQTFSDPEIQKLFANVHLLQADVTANDEDDKALLKYFGIYGPPTIAFFDLDGQERKGYRIVGYKSANDFQEHLTRLFAALNQ